MKNRKDVKTFIKLVILIILFLTIIISSFKTGERIFVLRNTNFDTSEVETKSEIAKWYFNAVIR